MIKYVDAHCHLDLYPDYSAEARAAVGVQTAVVTMTTTPRAWPRNVELAAKYDEIVPALGYHPQLIASIADELPIFDRYLAEATFIGEVGLDASPQHYRSLDAQKRVFSHILQKCAATGDRVLSIHSVRAAKPVLDLVEESQILASRCKVVLHWFTGSLAEGRRAISLGCYFSINPAMLERPHHGTLLAEIPGNRLLTESDGPFAQSATGQITSTSMANAIDSLAKIRGVAAEDVRSAVVECYQSLL